MDSLKDPELIEKKLRLKFLKIVVLVKKPDISPAAGSPNYFEGLGCEGLRSKLSSLRPNSQTGK